MSSNKPELTMMAANISDTFVPKRSLEAIRIARVIEIVKRPLQIEAADPLRKSIMAITDRIRNRRERITVGMALSYCALETNHIRERTF
jgi:hypothetical protein